MITNTNQVITENPSIPLDETFINPIIKGVDNPSEGVFKFDVQIAIFQFLADIHNKSKRLTIEGFGLEKQNMAITVNIKLLAGHYAIDIFDIEQAVADHLVNVMGWNAEKLVITTEPIAE